MTLYFEQNGQEGFVGRRIPPRNSAMIGDDGTQARFNNAPLSLAPPWQTTPQEVAPPALRQYRRIGGILPGDASDWNDTTGPLKVAFREGWQIQFFQPPAPFGRQQSPFVLGAGAGAKGDDGIGAVFVPPWQMASPLKSFPDIQSNVAAAIPSYNAGPQIGSISSMPNITTPTLLKGTPGTIFSVIVIAAGSIAGALYDATSVAAANAANQIAPIPTSGGPIFLFEWPCQYGIVLIPGAGQTLSAKWA